LIFEALPETLKNPNSIVYRHKLHNAATLAGMAIGNASVGVNHALAHALGARFDIAHGRANAAFLLSTIEYNSQIPSKFVSIPCYPLWVADRKYARAAQFIGLKDDAPAALARHLLPPTPPQLEVLPQSMQDWCTHCAALFMTSAGSLVSPSQSVSWAYR
jgi:alcohol dehydrogenase class IV